MKSLALFIVKLHLTWTDPKIKQMFRWLVIGFLAGLWLSLEEAQCNGVSTGRYTGSLCYNTSSVKTCFTKSLFNNPALKYVEQVSGWLSSTTPGSYLIVISSLESQRTVEIFIVRHVLANKTTIVLDAQKLSANVSVEGLKGNGDQTLLRDVTAKPLRDGACMESEDGHTLHYCVGYVKSQYSYICEYSGAFTGTPVTNRPPYSEYAYTDDSSHKQCICICPEKRKRRSNAGEAEYDGKWLSCTCNHNYAIVCNKVEDSSDAATTVGIDYTDELLPSTPADITSSPSHHGQRNSFDTIHIWLILLLFVAVVCIAVAVILIIRKRKHAGRHEVSPLKTTAQNEAVPPGYETMVPDNRPPGGVVPIYTELELTQQPTPSNSTTYASIQPTSEVVVIGKSVDYVDLDLPKKDQQKPKSADKGTVSVSPIYSQPFQPPTSDSNTDYVEPYKPDVKPTATAPVQSHQAATDQQNVYSLAKAIPSGDPNVIYSEPNKPKKSSTPTGKEVKVTDPVYLNVTEVKPGAGSGDVATQDPSAVYAEPIKLKKSP